MHAKRPQESIWRHAAGHKLLLALLIALIAFLSRFELFGPTGYLALLHKQQDYDHEVEQLHHLQQQNRNLHHSIAELKSDPAAIERIAREQLHLTKPGEVVFTYRDKNDRPAGAQGQ